MQITNVMAVSLDGRIASHPDETDEERSRLGFTNDDDREHLLDLLKSTDAVIVGSSSLKASGGAFAVRNDQGRFPIWAVLTNRGLTDGHRFYQQSELPRWLVSKEALDLPSGQSMIRNLVCGDAAPPRVIVDALSAAGCQRVLLFGGSSVNKQFYAEGLVNRLIVTVCPIILARSHALPLVAPDLPFPVHLRLGASQQLGNLVILSYDLIGRDSHGPASSY